MTLKTKQFRTAGIVTVALLAISFLGAIFVDDWNWGVEDFLLGGVLIFVTAYTFQYVTFRVTDRKIRLILGALVIAVFLIIWVVLATS